MPPTPAPDDCASPAAAPNWPCGPSLPSKRPTPSSFGPCPTPPPCWRCCVHSPSTAAAGPGELGHALPAVAVAPHGDNRGNPAAEESDALHPRSPHRRDVLRGAPPAPGERDAERGEFLCRPADAHAQRQTSRREHIQRRGLLGYQHRVVLS